MITGIICWVLILASGLGAYLFENGTGTAIILLSVAILPILSGLLLLFCRGKLTAGLTAQESLKRGEEGTCNLMIKNSGKLPLSRVTAVIEIENTLTGEKVNSKISLSVGRGKTSSSEIHISSAHCGKLKISIKKLQISDIFGIFAYKIKCDETALINITPEIYHVDISLSDTADFLTDSEHYSTQKPGYDPSETFRIREYAPGDPIKQIHWKLTEKTGKVLVRDFGLPIVSNMLILLETTAVSGSEITFEDMDTSLDTLFSLSGELIAQEISHSVGWRDGESGEYTSVDVENESDIESLQNEILSAKITKGESTVIGAYSEKNLQCSYAHVAVISPYFPPDISAIYHGNRVTAVLPKESENRAEIDSADIAAVTENELQSGVLTLSL